MPAFDLLLSTATPLPSVEAAEAIGAALEARGAEVSIIRDDLPAADPARITLVFAPHEVYPHLGLDPNALGRSLARTILVCSARPSGRSWARVVPLARAAAAVFDISDAGVTAFATAGVTAHRLRLGAGPADGPTGDLDTRPLDVVFMGTSTPRRLQLLATAAGSLSRRDIDLRLTEGVASAVEPVANFLAGEAKDRHLASAKIMLNLHPADDPLFEWLRARDALRNGCLLVSELSSGATPLDPGRHFVTADAAHVGPTIERLLDEPARLEEIRADGADFFRTQVRLVDEVGALLEAAAAVPPPDEQIRPVAVLLPEPDPTTPAADASAEDAILAAVTRQNAVLKRLFVEIRNLRREIAHVRHSVEDPTEPLVAVTSTPGWEHGGPRDVSVIITLHNYGRFVREALESSLASEGVSVEIVVIDDRSTDDGPNVVRSVMAEQPEAAIRFVEQRVNTGVQRARNVAFGHARAPFAFVLDADNIVYPRGLAKLREGLLADAEAAFAYGIIERFDDDGGSGLMGLEGWDERRLARSHYIDAMALVRVSAWQEVGGYVTDPALELGWEDYDLWLNFASHGYRGLHVREIVGRYRIHGISSLAITTLDTTELMGRLQARHSRFFRSVGAADR